MIKKMAAGLTLASLLSVSVVGGALAQENASAGNGGVSTTDASGGAVSIGSVDSGETSGSVVGAAVEEALVTGDDIAATVIAALGF